MEQVFDYVKIDVESSVSEAEIGNEELPEGVEYNGLVSDKTITSGGVVSSGASGSIDSSCKLSYGLNDISANEIYKDYTGKEFSDNNPLKYIKINGTVNLEITPGIKFNLTPETKHFEFKFDYSVFINSSASLTGNIINSSHQKEEPAPFVIPFTTLYFSPVAGVAISITPGVAIYVSGEISLKGNFTGTVGFSLSNNDGFQNLTTNPRFETEIKFKATVFIGLELNPKVAVLGHIATAELQGTIGVEVCASLALASSNTDEEWCISPSVHDCDKCIDGKIVGKITLNFSANILNSKNLKADVNMLNIEIKITDFYYSFDHQSFEFRKCPFQKHRITVTATDSSGEPIKFAYITIKDMNGELVKTSDINDYEITDENGKVSFYLQPGEYNISAIDNLGEYREVTKNLVVSNDAKSIYINLLTHDEILDDYYNQDNETPSQLSFGRNHSACITENGNLYMWGNNSIGHLGIGKTYTSQLTPIKTMYNIKDVSLGTNHSACVTKDDELYTWGYNTQYQLGNGSTATQINPVNILSNARVVSLGTNHSAAITRNNDLYTWGWNCVGQLGNRTTVNQSISSQEILSNIKMVSLGNDHSAAITEEGDLYMWGNNSYGKVGTGDTKNSLYNSPQFIMSGVKYVSLGHNHSSAITENGDLYMWGNNHCGQLGNGTKGLSETVYLPAEPIMSNIKQVSLGEYHSGAITEDGDLYMWGSNHFGELGDGTNEDKLTPTKITTITDKIKELELGERYTGVITESGEIYTWGYNSCGCLGDGTKTDRNTPTKITLPTETSTASLSSSSNLNSILSSVSNTTNVVASGTGTSSAQSFEGLMPNEIYNFYSMKSKNVSEPLSSENLLYISQAISDENGNLSIDYDMTKDYENAVCFVVPMKQTDLSSAKVTMDNLTYTGEEQFIHPTVTLDGVTLTEGKDYELCNYYYAQNVGEYSVTIRGIGYYTGEVEFIYYVNGKLGDINLDGNLSVVDAILVLRHVINSDTLTEQELLSADVNKDGSVTVVDAILIQKAVINVTNT